MSDSPPRTPSVPAPQQPLDELLAKIAARDADLDPPQSRDDKGRFIRGNPDAPGNPFARRVAKLRSILVNAVRDEDMKRIAEDLVVQAKFGNMAALKLLFLYVLGKPVHAVNPDTLDIEEWQQIFRPIPQIMREVPEALMTVPAATASDLVRKAQPYAQRMAAKEIKAPPPQPCEQATSEEASRQEDTDQPAKEKARSRPSPNGVLRPRGAVPKWLDQIAAFARMASPRRNQRRPRSG